MLTLYKNTRLRQSQNARYEGLESYLAGFQAAQFADFQYVKPALETYVKIQTDGWMRDKAWDYCKVTNGDGNVYYYYVARHRWVSENALGLTLAMDTVNTFWDSLTFTSRTHITRRFKNRFNVIHQGSSDTLVPIVDKFSEDIPNPPMYRTSISTIGDKHLWYIVQRTDYKNASDVSENPVSTYLLTDERLSYENTPITIDKTTMDQSRTYLLEPSSRERTITMRTSSGGSVVYKISFTSMWKVAYFYYSQKHGCINVKAIKTSDNTVQWLNNVTSIELTKVEHVFRQRSDFNPLDNYPSEMNQNFDYDDIIYYYSSEESSSVPAFDDWYRANKTDTNLVKISCLPYCPVELSSLKINSDYQVFNYGIKLINPNIEYRSLITADVIALEGFDKAKAVKLAQNYDLKYESKRYNSSYHTLKYVYDNNQVAFNLEDFNTFRTGSNNSESLDLTFYYNKEMSNSMAFRFDANYSYSTDYGEWLVCNKSLDVPYFTNEYLNYLRYGKAVDERNAGFSTVGTLLSGVSTGIGSTASAVAAGSIAKLAAGPIGWVTGAVGAASAIWGGVSSIVKTRDSINAKMDAYTHQASQVNGTSDLSIFKAYGDNKLLKVVYDPPEELLTPILDYFRLFGYSTDEYAVPDLSTRHYSDYIMMEPDFAEDSIDSDYLDDIKARCQAGLRVYHYHDGYDLDCLYENWEEDLLA